MQTLANAEALGADPKNVIIGGGSAGANMVGHPREDAQTLRVLTFATGGRYCTNGTR